MTDTPPEGSRINVTQQAGHPTVLIPYDGAGITAYLVGVFMVFWLGAWFLGFVAVLASILTGQGGSS